MGCSSCSSGADGLPRGCKNNGRCGTCGCGGKTTYDWLEGIALPEGVSAFDIVEVRFKNNRKGFYRRKSTESYYVGDVVTLEIDGESAIIQMNKNMGNAIIRGARFDFTTQVFPNTIFKSTVNINKGTIITSDSPLAHIPPTFGRSSLEYSKQKWSIETFVLYSGKKNIDSYGPGSTDNPQETLSDGNPSWWTLNIESHLEFHENIHAQFGVSNILDMHYKSFSSAISAPGRGVYIALHATF